MNIILGLKYLLFDQKSFFEIAPKGLLLPFAVTLIYAVISVLMSIPTLLSTMSSVPGADALGDLTGIMIGISAVSVVITTFVIWIVLSLIFFVCVKVIGYSGCKFGEMLGVVSYPAVILSIEAILVGLISLVGTPLPLLTLLLSGVFLFWTIPVWIFGIQSITGLEVPKVIKCIAVPVIVMVIVSVIGFAMGGSI